MGTGFRTAASTLIAARKSLHPEFLLRTEYRFLEGQREAGSQILPWARASTCTRAGKATEKALEDVIQIRKARETTQTAFYTGVPETIIRSALVAIGQHLIGFVDLLEKISGVGTLIHIRVILARQLSISLANAVFAGLSSHP
jgi:hypothetical protein